MVIKKLLEIESPMNLKRENSVRILWKIEINTAVLFVYIISHLVLYFWCYKFENDDFESDIFTLQ